ncbi:hypothetical protein L873DRAFT_1812880 [Choiromyces venosus 120613-1]|uniref:Uncharacterized protein n=1 Tax=Choiromyces venosus 120613-1 TaxID=1336337 RepID=A0A3N4JDN5_9PEZI|nr:hypothetical protein L873DRAFT_1812880 [Choiromyces venosus 120613-1]
MAVFNAPSRLIFPLFSNQTNILTLNLTFCQGIERRGRYRLRKTHPVVGRWRSG